MRFACDSCGAQYMIADEKVGDRGVKVKCKKCGNMIVVKPRAAEAPAAAAPAPEPPPSDDTTGETTSVSAPPVAENAPATPSVGGAFDAVFGAPESPAAAAPAESSFSAPDASVAGLGALAGLSGADSSATAGSGETAPNTGDSMMHTSSGGGDAFGFSAPAAAPQPHGETDLALNALGKVPTPVAPSGRPAGEKEWYVAIDDAQVGPIDLVEIEQRWDARELDADSLAWKAGMADWIAIAEIAELAYLAVERSQQRPVESAFGAPKPATSESTASLASYASTPSFSSGSGGSGEAVAWTPSAASALSSLVQDELVVKKPEVEAPKAAAPDSLGLPSFGAGDLFGGGGGGLSDAVGAAPAPAAVASAPLAPAPQTPAADPFAGGGGGWAVPQPRRSSGGSNTKIAVIAAGVLFVVAVGAVGVVFMRDRQAEQDKQMALLQQQLALQAAKQAQPPAPPPQVVAQNTAQPDGQAAVGTDAATQAKPSDGQPADVKPADAKPADVKPGPGDVDGKPTKTKAGGTKVATTKTGTKTQPDRGQTKKQGGGGDIDDILRESTVKDALTKDDIVNGVRTNGAKLGPCIQAARSKGEVNPGPYKLVLDWTINPNGSVTNGRLKGPGEVLGTSLPACFASVMGSWRFPASKSGAPVSNYPLAINVK